MFLDVPCWYFGLYIGLAAIQRCLYTLSILGGFLDMQSYRIDTSHLSYNTRISRAPSIYSQPIQCLCLNLPCKQIARPLITSQENRTTHTNPSNPRPYPRKERPRPALVQY